jgi:hypothetical protein
MSEKLIILKYYLDAPIVMFHVKEPDTIDEAVRIVASDMHFTPVNIETHRKADQYGLHGGYGESFILMGQRGVFASNLTPELLVEGMKIREYNKALERDSEEYVLGKRSIRIGEKRLVDHVGAWNAVDQDDMCHAARFVFLNDPRALGNFEKQRDYQKRLLDYLKTKVQHLS